MTPYKPLLGLGLLAVLVLGAVTPIAAHETKTLDGYDVTVGATAEPVITGERTWLQLEIVDNGTGEPVANQAETLTVSLQRPGGAKVPFPVSERHGAPGVYEVAVIFTDPGTYLLHLEGSIAGTDVHTHFEIEVHDRTALEFPRDGARATESDSGLATDG